MFKDRMEGANVTKGAIFVGGNGARKLACFIEQYRNREVKILVVEDSWVVAKFATFASQFTNQGI